METPNTILVLKLKAADAQGAGDEAYFSAERFAAASDDECIILEEQRIKAAQDVTRLIEEAYAEFYQTTASA